MEKMEFNGVWILPNGNILRTDSIRSHSETLKNLNLYDEIKQNSDKLTWNETEKQKYLDSDIAYIAFKTGYIRITCILGQIGIEYLGESLIKNRKTVIYCVQELCHNPDCITVEMFQSGHYMFLKNINELVKFIDSGCLL